MREVEIGAAGEKRKEKGKGQKEISIFLSFLGNKLLPLYTISDTNKQTQVILSDRRGSNPFLQH